VRWHRAGFRCYWREKSRSLGGRPQIETDLRVLIRRMNFENPLWGAPRIHGELLKLGFGVAQSSVAKYMIERRGRPARDGEATCATTRRARCICARFCNRTHATTATSERIIIGYGRAGHSPNSANREHQITRHPGRTSSPLPVFKLSVHTGMIIVLVVAAADI
jgi:hypothetical protein